MGGQQQPDLEGPPQIIQPSQEDMAMLNLILVCSNELARDPDRNKFENR